MNTEQTLQQTIDDMVDDHRGILAADESLPTIAKRFAPIGVESTPETRRAYRTLLLITPGLGDYISGVILFEDTLGQTDDEGTPLPEIAWSRRIVPGVKVDKGKRPLSGAPGDLITRGLDGLGERLECLVKHPLLEVDPAESIVVEPVGLILRQRGVSKRQGVVDVLAHLGESPGQVVESAGVVRVKL